MATALCYNHTTTRGRISDFLSEAGALAVTLVDAEQQALFEPDVGATPLWQSVEIKGLFPHQYNIAALQEQLLQTFGMDKIARSTCASLADQKLVGSV